MATGQNKHPENISEKKKWLTILVPAAGVAVLIILVVVVGSVADKPQPTGKNRENKSEGSADLAAGPGMPMSDGSDGSTSDPGLKDIGEGLKIRDLKEGTGAECPVGASVEAHYTGWTTNGNVFDSSHKHGDKPIVFSLHQVVQGWQKGIPGMKVGGIRKLVIPSELGYGSRGSGQNIPPYSTLIFEVELVAIK